MEINRKYDPLYQYSFLNRTTTRIGKVLDIASDLHYKRLAKSASLRVNPHLLE